MKDNFLPLLLFGALAALGNILGGLLLFPAGLHRYYQRFLKYLLALGAGFMLAVTFFEIFPQVFLLWTKSGDDVEKALVTPMALILGGYLITQFFEHTVAPHLHLGGELHCDDHDHAVISAKTAYTTIGGLVIHTFFDGVSIAAASKLDLKVGFVVFLAVLLHKLPEGFTIGSLVLAAGKTRKHVMTATLSVGATTFAGVLAFIIAGDSARDIVPYALPVAAGVTVYVAASDLIPEVNHHAGTVPAVSFCVFLGVALFAAIEFLAEVVHI